MKDGERGEVSTTPWIDEGVRVMTGNPSGGCVATCHSGATIGSTPQANAAFIVKAVNAYASNQATIRELVEALESIGENCKMTHARPCFICDVVKMAKEKSTKQGRG